MKVTEQQHDERKRKMQEISADVSDLHPSEIY